MLACTELDLTKASGDKLKLLECLCIPPSLAVEQIKPAVTVTSKVPIRFVWRTEVPHRVLYKYADARATICPWHILLTKRLRSRDERRTIGRAVAHEGGVALPKTFAGATLVAASRPPHGKLWRSSKPASSKPSRSSSLRSTDAMLALVAPFTLITADTTPLRGSSLQFHTY